MKYTTRLIFAAILAILSFSVWADPPGSGGSNGNGCTENCGHGGQGRGGGSGGSGGNGGNGGTGVGVGVGVGIGTGVSSSASKAISGSSSGAAAIVNSSGSGYGGSQSQSNGDIKTYSLGAAAVGSPSNDTCAAHVALLFGLATFPVTLESCVALNEALFLVKLEERKAAVERLCQLSSIAKTSLCPKWNAAEARAKEPPQ